MRPVVEVTKDTKKALQQVGRQLFSLCTPWPSWIVSSGWVVKENTTGKVTENDDDGWEVLSYVPAPLVADFLSEAGQLLVSESNITVSSQY